MLHVYLDSVIAHLADRYEIGHDKRHQVGAHLHTHVEMILQQPTTQGLRLHLQRGTQAGLNAGGVRAATQLGAPGSLWLGKSNEAES